MIEPITIPVREVTVLEDRAQVVRRGRVDLPAGASRLRIAGAAPVLADKTLYAVLTPAGEADGQTGAGDADAGTPERARVSDARVNDVRVRRMRRILGADKPEERHALEQELTRSSHEQERLRTRQEQLRAHEENLSGLAARTLNDIAVDVGHGRADPERWRRVLGELEEQEQSVRRQRLEVDLALAELEDEIGRLQQRMAATARLDDTIGAELMLDVWTAAAGAYDLRVDYVVPGACWRPYHRARLVEGEQTVVELTSEGCVWQNTGEDWDDVQLVFSTERPSLGTEPPRLATDLVTAQRRSEKLEVEAREQEVQTTGLGAGQRKSSPELPGIDDGGEALHLRAEARATIPSDGQPYRVPLLSFTAEASSRHVLMAELAGAVILESRQVNEASRPLLAGPVDLVRGHGYVGRTSVLFIAPGERFALGWGPDSAIRVQRTLEQAKEERGMMSSWTTQAHTVRVRVSNLAPEAKTIHITERVPVSEVEKVGIEVDVAATTDRLEPDGDGFVRWEAALPALGHTEAVLRYVVRRHADVVGI